MQSAIRCIGIFLSALLLLGASLTSAQAVDPVNANILGQAIRGYDPVAYFTIGKPAEGNSAYRFDWQGATWWFASQQNLAAFKADPEKYAPQYGGYCAYAVAKGGTANIAPNAWHIRDGKLYLNKNPEVQALWNQDIPGHITSADKNWPSILNK